MGKVYNNYQSLNHDNDDITTGNIANEEVTPLCDAEMAKNIHSVKSQQLPSPVSGGKIMSLYVLLGIFFGGICIGFSFGFYVSTQYWHSDIGQLRTASMNQKKQQQQVVEVSDMITLGTFQHSEQEQEAPLMRFSLLNNDDDDDQQEQPPSLIYLHHLEAYSLLLNDNNNMNNDNDDTTSLSNMLSSYSLPYFLISSGWDVQKNQAYCAVATATSILNSLRFLGAYSSKTKTITSLLPTDPAYQPFAYATQDDIFNSCTNKNIIYRNNINNNNGIMDGILTPPFGLSMMQMADLFRQCYFHNATSDWHDAQVKVQHVDHTHLTLAKMRFDLMNALESTKSRVMINYNRHMVGQVGGGHWSPLAAYSPSKDAFLVMDVAKYKYPPVWIPTPRLYDAMGTTDPCGIWDYPHAQTKLNHQQRLALTPQLYQQAMEKLNCQPAYRGYIILTLT